MAIGLYSDPSRAAVSGKQRRKQVSKRTGRNTSWRGLVRTTLTEVKVLLTSPRALQALMGPELGGGHLRRQKPSPEPPEHLDCSDQQHPPSHTTATFS